MKLSRALRLAGTEGKRDVYWDVKGNPVGREEERDATVAHNVLGYLLAASELYAPVTCGEVHDEVSK